MENEEDHDPCSHEGYHQFVAEDGTSYGSFEVFCVDSIDLADLTSDPKSSVGWYWWACFPGCMPDSEIPSGPFETSREAYGDAQGE